MNTIVFALLILGGVPRPAWIDEKILARREGSSIALYASGSTRVRDCTTLDDDFLEARLRALDAIGKFKKKSVEDLRRRRMSEKGLLGLDMFDGDRDEEDYFGDNVTAWFDVSTKTIFLLVRTTASEDLVVPFGKNVDPHDGQWVATARLLAEEHCDGRNAPRFVPAWTTRTISVDVPLHAIDGLDERTVWAAGDRGAIFERQGKAWKKVDAPAIPGALRALWIASRDEGWAVGDQGAIVHRLRGRWRTEPSPTKSTLRAVIGRSNRDVFAAGDDGAVIHFDGTRWAIEEVPAVSRLNGAATDAAGRVLIAGANGVVLEHDGHRWMVSHWTGLDGMFVDVAIPSADRRIVVASTFDRSALRRTSDILVGGDARNLRRNAVVPARVAACALVSRGDELLLAGVNGDLYATSVREPSSVERVAQTGAWLEDLIAFDKIGFAAADDAIVELTRIK